MSGKKINEFVKHDMTPISGDIPQYNTSQVYSTKTSDEVNSMVNQNTKYPNYYGLGYITEEEEENIKSENVIPKSGEINAFDIFNKNDVELPDIYDITNRTLVPKLHSLVAILNSDDNEVDKVAIFSEFISKVKLNTIDNKYKKELIKKLKTVL